MSQVIVKTASECQLKCKADGQCKFFTYVKSAQRCHLKNAKTKVTSGNADLISGPEICCFAHKIDYLGNDIRAVQTETAEDCQKACQKEHNCKYWTFVKSIKKCHLKNAKSIGGTNSDDLVSGPRTCPGKLNFN